MVIRRMLMYFNRLKCNLYALFGIAETSLTWTCGQMTGWTGLNHSINDSLSFTDTTWTDGHEVSVLSVSGVLLGMGERSPLILSCFEFPLIQTPILFCACVWKWIVWLFWVTDLCSHLEVHWLMRSSWLTAVYLKHFLFEKCSVHFKSVGQVCSFVHIL